MTSAPLFHATSYAAVNRIAVEGLQPGRGGSVFRWGSYAGHSAGRVFLAGDPWAARAWLAKVAAALEHNAGDADCAELDLHAERIVPVLLRVDGRWRGVAQVDPVGSRHGTPRARFREFDPRCAGDRTGRCFPGIYFSNAYQGAATYSGGGRGLLDRNDFREMYAEKRRVDRDRWSEGGEYPAGVYACYLRICYPFEVDFGDRGFDQRATGIGANNRGEVYYGMDDVAEAAVSDGGDGVIAHNVCDEGPYGRGYCHGDKTFIVWDAAQIKSANANRGTFSRKTDNILMGWRR